MKKMFIILITILFIPMCVNAESQYLYDVLKDEAENNGLAREYTGEHHDSFTKEPSKKIYHWYAESDDEGNQVIEKNNVIFGNFCWQIIRTTDTGGVKMIYNGIPNTLGQCLNQRENQTIGESEFNTTISGMIYVGYMYNEELLYPLEEYTGYNTYYYGKNVTYNNGVYTLVNTTRGIYSGYHYTCGSNSTTCETVKYYPVESKYIVLKNGEKIEDAINKMTNDDSINNNNSTIKNNIDEWYNNNMKDYTNYIEDTIFCNDRFISDKKCWDPNGPASGGMLLFNNYYPKSDLSCTNITDMFSVNNEKAKLDFPVGLMSVPEMNLLNNNKIRKTGDSYYLISPSYYSHVSGGTFVDSNGKLYFGYNDISNGIRPAISLKPKSRYSAGDGSKSNPYIIDITDYYKVIVEEAEKKGNIEFEVSDINSLEEGTVVKFKIVPNKGYEVDNITIKDEEQKNVEYHTTDKINYTFTMPATDVTITTQYKKIDSILNPNTKRQILLIVLSIIILSIMTIIFIRKKKSIN